MARLDLILSATTAISPIKASPRYGIMSMPSTTRSHWNARSVPTKLTAGPHSANTGKHNTISRLWGEVTKKPNKSYIWLICGSINFANLSMWNCLNFKVRSHIFSRCPLCKFRSSVLFRLEKHVEKRHQGIQVEGFIAEVYNKNKPIGPLTTHSKKPLTEHYTINSDGVSYEAFNKYRSNPNLFSSW